MAVEAHLVSGPIGPDTIQIPGEPQRLRRSAEALRELCQQLEDTGQQLRQADAPEGKRGRTVRSLSNVAGRTGRTLQSDVERLQKLSDAVQNQAELLGKAHDDLDALRQRWRQARQELRDAAQSEQTRRQAKNADHEGGGKGKPHQDDDIDVHALIQSIDEDVADEHANVISRLSGVHFGGGGTGGQAQAMLVDGELDRAMTAYRQGVRSVLEDLTESLRRVHRADEEMAEHLPRHDKAVVSAQEADFDAAGGDHANVVSGPEEIRSVAQEVQEASRAIDQAAGHLREIRLGIREGRMLPDDDRIGSSDGFQRDWTAHFDDLREDLNHARKAGAEIADRLAEIDQDGARQVRRASNTKD